MIQSPIFSSGLLIDQQGLRMLLLIIKNHSFANCCEHFVRESVHIVGEHDGRAAR